ncbi:hypothetical protein [Paenibacillus lautus]|uniref:hypothetical protein n=1 Tax=Paenibacillus lautus TaxID=1401 RepID=UPI003D2AEECA
MRRLMITLFACWLLLSAGCSIKEEHVIKQNNGNESSNNSSNVNTALSRLLEKEYDLLNQVRNSLEKGNYEEARAPMKEMIGIFHSGFHKTLAKHKDEKYVSKILNDIGDLNKSIQEKNEKEHVTLLEEVYKDFGDIAKILSLTDKE